MRVHPDRRSALVLLALALAGSGVRLMLGEQGAPGAVAYHPSARHAPQDSAGRDSLAARALRLARPLRVGDRIDIDRAPVEELARLPRVGPGLAARIVSERDARGPFGSMDGLAQRVAGVGQTLRDAVQPYADFTGKPVGVTPGVVLHPGERLLVGADEPPPAAKGSRRAPPVPLNTATADDLARVPGISARLAAQIVSDRVAHGPFRSLQDLGRVRGVSAALLKRLQARLAVP